MKRLFSRLMLPVLLIGMLLVFYVTSPLKELPPQLVLGAHKPNGELVEQQVITPDDPVYRRLKSLLDSERTGWWWNLTSSGPSPYVLRAEGLTIRCFENGMVIEVYGSGHPRSYRKEAPNLLQTLGLPVSSDWEDRYKRARSIRR